MKNSLCKGLCLMTAGVFLMWSCKKEGVHAVLTPGASPQLAGSTNAVVLDSTKNSTNAVTFTWPAVDYGYSADVTYTLQFDASASDSFKNATNITLPTNKTSLSYTVQTLNVLAYQSLGLPANVASPIWVRVKSDINQNGVTTGASSVASIYSNVFNMTVTPYQIIIIYPTLWVPGDYQGWSPSTAPTIASVKSNNVYEGYVNFPTGGTFQFKYTSAPDWNHLNYGWVSSTTNGNTVTGTMNTSGGNLFVPAAGYYQLKADLNPTPNAWSATGTTWGVIGDATPGGWGSDTQLTFDAGTQTWSVTLNLVSTGSWKFRANSAWAINLGYDNGALDYNGSNIVVPPAGSGNYTITLDLSHSGNYVYSIKHN
jgi:hypothetical protein